jgi:N-acetylglucosamine kinase-like BadF-type ATPase
MRYVLGFDGGGTKTECVLMDDTGEILARSFSGPSNPFRIGVERATGEIQTAADLALRQAGIDLPEIAAISAGLAGTAQTELKEQMRSALQQAFPGAVVSVFTDLEMSLAAAGEGPVIVLVVGTGSAAVGRDSHGKVYRAGGYGTSSSDEGSAYDIGRHAVAQAMKLSEEKGCDSSLGKKILAQFSFPSWAELQQRANQAPDEVFPRIFPIVAAEADAGDSHARGILSQAAADLSSLVVAVADQLGPRTAAVFLAKTGGALGRSIFFDAHLDAALLQLLPNAQIGGLRMSPAEAAAHAAKY